ncbi:DUF4367 domain-containing protein [Paenibacillus crassostreae]|uniref:DUF4367 domain-containing protein n=1 Tax=Paenibacillus crassostreae TaxID=1763538 RepID=A0A167DVH9_9BACL|nr:DUF4367 domain-containing protein [Paenibacillus crassostreae]AOZ91014.1 hypothetical protein LPB68_01545 [Paenibacillus crassostreae]OAB74824.1 hypothetical protein PNBC_12410 [Paenibacillus crassostreae]
MNNERFDQWFDDTFEQSVSTTSLTSDESKKQSWQKVQVEIHKLNKSKKRKRHFQLAGIVAASVAAGSIIFNPPAVTQAISPVFQSIKNLGNGVVNIIVETYSQPNLDEAITAPPPENYPEDPNNPSATLHSISEDKSYVLTMEEVQDNISFIYPDFQKIPERFQLMSSEMADLTSGQKADSITMTYRTTNGEPMRIMLQSFSERQMGSSSSGSLETEILTLNNDIEVFFTPGRFNDVQFIYNGLSVRIFGNVSKEELIAITESLPN